MWNNYKIFGVDHAFGLGNDQIIEDRDRRTKARDTKDLGKNALFRTEIGWKMWSDPKESSNM